MKNEEPAYPFSNSSYTRYLGMSLRDYFAGQALIGILINGIYDKGQYMKKSIAETAYQMADAMLEERER